MTEPAAPPLVSPDLESARPPTGPDFVDAVTVAFGDLGAQAFGLARIGVVEGGRAAALGLLFSGQDVAAVDAQGDLELPAGSDWAAGMSAGAVALQTVEPLNSWRVQLDAAEGGFDLELRALCPPAQFAARGLDGREAYEQVCHVEGTVRTAGKTIAVDCLGQRGHAWGAVDWAHTEALRSVSAWLHPDLSVLARAARPEGASGHEAEELDAVLIDGAGPGALIQPVEGPRLSTTYDAEGRQRRAGFELWLGEDDEYPRRAAGAVLCGTSIALGRLRAEEAFFAWTMDDRAGVGRYGILRRA